MTNDVIKNIQTYSEKMSKGQKLIAEYILAHYDKAAFMTALKLGKVVGVSESTVVRFAFELGYDGYPDLQKAMLEMIKNRLTSVQRIEVASEQIGSSEVLDKVLNNDIEQIKKTLSATSHSDFNEAIDSVVSSKCIYIMGAGSASALAGFLSFYFNLMLPNVKLIDTTSSSEMFEQIIRIDENDVIIGISFPRYSKRTSKALNFAKNTGATVIAITDSMSSPLVKDADFILEAKSDMTSFVDSLVAPLSLINALIVAVGLQKSDELKQTFNKLEAIWDEYDVYEKQEDSTNE